MKLGMLHATTQDSDDAAHTRVRLTDAGVLLPLTRDSKGRRSGERGVARAKITLKWLRDKAQIICGREQQGYLNHYTRTRCATTSTTIRRPLPIESAYTAIQTPWPEHQERSRSVRSTRRLSARRAPRSYQRRSSTDRERMPTHSLTIN